MAVKKKRDDEIYVNPNTGVKYQSDRTHTPDSFVDPRTAMMQKDWYRGYTPDYLANKEQQGGVTKDWLTDTTGDVDVGSLGTGGFNANVSDHNVTRNQLKGAADVAALYGNIDFDPDTIEALFRNAIAAEYDERSAAHDRHLRGMDQQLSDLAVQREMMQQREMANRVQSGASQGISAITNMLEQRDAEQRFSDQRLEALAERRGIDEQRATADAQASVQAEAEATARRQQLAQIASQLYGIDSEYAATELGHHAQLETARLDSSSRAYSADQSLRGDALQSNATRDAARYGLQGQEIYRDATIRSAEISANAEKAIADLQWDSNKLAVATNMIMEMNDGKYDFTKAEDFNNFADTYGQLLGIDFGVKPEAKEDKDTKTRVQRGLDYLNLKRGPGDPVRPLSKNTK